MTLSGYQEYKATIQTLSREEKIILFALGLTQLPVTLSNLTYIIRTAGQHGGGIGKWSGQGVEKIVVKLQQGGLLLPSAYHLQMAPSYRIPVLFATDSLEPATVDALVHGINTFFSFPADGTQSNGWRVDYDHLAVRMWHKVIQHRPTEYERLHRALFYDQRFYHRGQEEARNRHRQLIGFPDGTFWQHRPAYFRWAHFNEQQNLYASWEEDTPRWLLPTLRDLAPAVDGQAYDEDVRTVALLAMHAWRHHAEALAFDPGLTGVAHLLNGNPAAAAADFSRLPPPDGLATAVDVIALACRYGRGELTLPEVSQLSGGMKKSAYPALINAWLGFVRFEEGQHTVGEELLLQQFTKRGVQHPIEWMVALWCVSWAGLRVRFSRVERLMPDLADHYDHIPWVRHEILTTLLLLFPAHPGADDWRRRREEGARTQVQGEVVLQGLLPTRARWQHTMRLLAAATQAAGADDEAGGEPEYRTIWVVDFTQETVQCKEQKRGKRGWSKGRRLKWSELLKPQHPEAMDPADARALSALVTYNGRPLSAALVYGEDSLFADFGRMLYEIADHPRVYRDDKKRIPIEIIRAEPELVVIEEAGGLALRFDPPVEKAGYVYRKETPTRYRVYHLSEQQGEIAWAIGHGVTVPDTERAAVEQMVDRVRHSVTVQSTFDLIDEDLEEISGDPTPCVHLLPFNDGYQIALYAKPVVGEPIYFKPGEGLPRSVVVTEDGRRLLIRDLAEEQAGVAAVRVACPTLARLPGSHFEYNIEEAQTALRILLELRALVADGAVTIEHPKGEQLKITAVAGANELAIRIGKQRDWFEVSGAVTVNEQRVVDLERLLEHLRERKDNPFVELANGEFLALTDDLRDRVLEMEGLLHQQRGKLQLPTLAAGAFQELAEDLEDVEADDAWQESLARIKRAGRIRPRVPQDFRAELRDYQAAGFRWLMRLAEWGVGACLADDMGLGKTVQALAMLTARAARGPALVIAPASVTRNWRTETERFAPGLVPVLIGSSQEVALLGQLGPGDLALVSYGLLSFIGDDLAAVDWATIVLDEAQAIKNTATKRAKIVQGLSADFKLATTGTPIENHLGELWSLFRFLNPGLLGSKEKFNEKFNRPIAKGDEDRRLALKNLVKPFILRRRKDEVLTELPPKTEIILQVDLSEEEKALYEALRRQALKDIAAADEQQKRFTVLASLTKLRQAACHPRLVRPRSKLGSAKLELVGETLLDILQGGHKALIFSQFVKHLRIVENWVKGQGIPYQYLDGSTPGKQREASVKAFQAGEGEVFLISLKAGGTGLNLTEADYVLHLDPWWNPAAEDQASDRAHRIGQQRPVTVYRFVSAGTVEEQIIALHTEKRDLADQILSGTGRAGQLSVDDILTLLKN